MGFCITSYLCVEDLAGFHESSLLGNWEGSQMSGMAAWIFGHEGCLLVRPLGQADLHGLAPEKTTARTY